LIATSPEQWLDAINQLCGKPEDWHSMSSAAHAFARDHYGPKRGLERMRAALQTVALPTC
jgi:hypothetical protein